MQSNKVKAKVYNHDPRPDIVSPEINKLGRPHHKIPKIVNSYFSIIESEISLYFLKKYRINITLDDIKFQTNCSHKNAKMLTSQMGNIAFDIDRLLLLNILNDYYGLSQEKYGLSQEKKTTTTGKLSPLTKTEERLKNKLGLEITDLFLNQPFFGEHLIINNSTAALIACWSYRIDFFLKDYNKSGFSIFIDAPHIDRLIDTIKTKNEKAVEKNVSLSERQLEHLVKKLPVTLTSQLSNINLTLAELMALKEGDIISASLPEYFPVFIGKEALFSAAITENRGKLFFSEFNDQPNEMNHD
ncbi:FliM/FliN family flagellar motor switch protein [Yersinia pestis]|uniref:FliM/FliN family flagellar motor switch protein n=1 Tax=Yersinia pestis TaxID=632 RepID=UPI0005E74F06|nr:FliM/FliN family flagellar motor switch protein [Yersinia pestis]KJG84938.1 flagellar motor switch protein FliM [Yersinia pestis subsp. microtus bv. Ulegeica]KJG88114.1 flagellar motor switch protein FliM [Yersinia pestis subsp. microtus bv. Ulegeica]KPD43837.1 flagellar motor switch protein FliM [Yersinia pestis subsp. microtus bv. Ulegeica]KPE00460.1 flagellar motor switch protein FliM [Yersinia pestis subsp. microtus bv. Ulegeica]KPE11560.1 flagellar motor switch protein FliM [Yersinia p